MFEKLPTTITKLEFGMKSNELIDPFKFTKCAELYHSQPPLNFNFFKK